MEAWRRKGKVYGCGVCAGCFGPTTVTATAAVTGWRNGEGNRVNQTSVSKKGHYRASVSAKGVQQQQGKSKRQRGHGGVYQADGRSQKRPRLLYQFILLSCRIGAEIAVGITFRLCTMPCGETSCTWPWLWKPRSESSA